MELTAYAFYAGDESYRHFYGEITATLTDKTDALGDKLVKVKTPNGESFMVSHRFFVALGAGLNGVK